MNPTNKVSERIRTAFLLFLFLTGVALILSSLTLKRRHATNDALAILVPVAAVMQVTCIVLEIVTSRRCVCKRLDGAQIINPVSAESV